MDTTTQNSVLMNLEDLFVMEADRRVEEVAAAERVEAEAAARVERERREREDAIRVAREDERARAQAQLDAQNAAVESRIQTLRAEIDQIRQDRERTQLEVAAMAVRAETPSRRGNWVAGTMAAMSLVAALTATFVAWPQPSLQHELPGPVAAETVVTPEAPVLDVTADVSAAPEVPEVVATAAPVEASPTERVQPRHPPRNRDPRPPAPANDLGSQLDFGDDDGLIPQ